MALDPLDARPLLLLVGPTASGKSAFAPELALALGAEIASLDSMLVYQGMDVGTAKPDAATRARVPHHLIDLVPPSAPYSVSRYVDDARTLVERLLASEKPALFVGGTALYLKALTHGLFDGPDVDPSLRAELAARWESQGGQAMFAELGRVDAASAARLHPNDRKRVLRALEVHAQSGRALSDWQREWRAGEERSVGRARRIVALEVDLAELERRIPERTRALLDGGWVEEAVRVRATTGFGPTAAQALGYAEVLELADGVRTRAECEARINLRTRQFARRQRTWFRQFPEISWIRATDADALEKARAHLAP
ncbi:MAG TPA: tRNA (adenosine(37)-N6)-dimethylallyltransferase MiaA [Planctomycetota bacterium]|nr:tRNA (adenosine(37)-N6)-dimethylallyltransferase MiaA [Planctomycetota bacterium]